jgi:hypothetical protein
MIEREEAVKRCQNCIYCHPATDGFAQFLGCQVCANKWIAYIDRCPITQGREQNAEKKTV